MNGALFRQTWYFQRIRLACVCIGLAAWGFLLPVVYARFGSNFRALMDSGMFPSELGRFGGGDIFSLPGAIALSLIHPIAIILISVFAVGFASTSVAGERQRGTLETLLARPLSRRVLYLTVAAAELGFIALAVTSLLTGTLAGATFAGVVSEVDATRLPILALNAWLLFGAFGAIGLAASVSFDRQAPALGVSLSVMLFNYAADVIGSLWPAAEWLQPYSLFHYLKGKAILTGGVALADLGVLAAVILVAVAWALVVFPARDIAAPT
jgi:ABC-type transport system involved in multi-copper enzyme maturation permease subunit